MVWGKSGTPLTLSGAADDLDIIDLAGKKFNMIISHVIDNSNQSVNRTFNNDSGSVYAFRRSQNGLGEVIPVSQSLMSFSVFAGYGDLFFITYACWISGEEKLGITHLVQNQAAGASGEPSRGEFVSKYVPTSLTDTLDRIDFNNPDAGSYDTNSNISALGTD
tara:strand:- start:223 stop:711 length:489 start_codon:yes stop_codon:yes gene_type:complete